MENKISKLYRVIYVSWRDFNRLNIEEYRITKHTPEGFWIIMPSGQKWVSATSKKRYAYPTKTEAMEGFKYRKIRQFEILEIQLKNAKCGLKEAEEYLAKNQEINVLP